MKNIIIDCTENEKSINVKIAYSINHNNEFNNKEIKDYIDYSKLTEADFKQTLNNLIFFHQAILNTGNDNVVLVQKCNIINPL